MRPTFVWVYKSLLSCLKMRQMRANRKLTGRNEQKMLIWYCYKWRKDICRTLTPFLYFCLNDKHKWIHCVNIFPEMIYIHAQSSWLSTSEKKLFDKLKICELNQCCFFLFFLPSFSALTPLPSILGASLVLSPLLGLGTCSSHCNWRSSYAWVCSWMLSWGC